VSSFLISLLVLVAILAVGVGAIVTIRRLALCRGDDRGDWERTLVDWRNLRDEGVLSEEEFRKIRTLAEPRTRIGMPAPRGRQQPPGDSTGPEHERD
jgi:hypothetical protein